MLCIGAIFLYKISPTSMKLPYVIIREELDYTFPNKAQESTVQKVYRSIGIFVLLYPLRRSYSVFLINGLINRHQ